ncbi:MAG: two-component sensor histidine kinase [Phormidium tanganyikae FI6-MK23]|jgi:signal transduction histidine kinase|nr:two-component sensor histidine kinase [Phormidium tanganyikae FI6-MK23]
MFNRSRRNLTGWFMLSMGSILLTFAGISYYLTAIERLRTLDYLLYKKAQVVAATIQYEHRNERSQLDLSNVPYLGNLPLPPNSDTVYARWYNAQGQLQQFFGVAAIEPLKDAPEFQTLTIGAGILSNQPVLVRQITLPVQYQKQRVGYLQIAVPLTQVESELQHSLLVTLICILITLGIIAGAGWALSGLAMQPIQAAYDHLQRFTADASHELRTPLAAILSNAQVGLLAPHDAGERKHQRLEKIAEVAKSMTTLISSLLFLARCSGQLAAEALQPVDLVNTLRELVNEPTIKTVAQSITLNLEVPEQAVIVNVDRELLQQAITNLVTNACKYTPAGGRIDLRLFTHFRQAVIQVEDTGIGIPESDLPYIFERFYRVNASRSRETGGLGLGLAIAQQIIAAHRGTLTVQSQVGKGSIFQITLPR